MNYKPFFAGEMAATLCFLPSTVFERNESAPPADDPATFCPVRRVSIQGVKSLWGGSRRFSEIGHWGH